MRQSTGRRPYVSQASGHWFQKAIHESTFQLSRNDERELDGGRLSYSEHIARNRQELIARGGKEDKSGEKKVAIPPVDSDRPAPTDRVAIRLELSSDRSCPANHSSAAGQSLIGGWHPAPNSLRVAPFLLVLLESATDAQLHLQRALPLSPLPHGVRLQSLSLVPFVPQQAGLLRFAAFLVLQLPLWPLQHPGVVLPLPPRLVRACATLSDSLFAA